MRLNIYLIFLLSSVLLLSGCSLKHRLNTLMVKRADPVIDQAFLGFSIYDVSKGRFLYEQQADHVFTPASNTKLLTCFASMQHLPDSIPGFFIYQTPDTLYIRPNGDPTFLHPDFREQAFFDFLKASEKPMVLLMESRPDFLRMGSGWSWSDYQATYMPERSLMPIYGNLVRFIATDSGVSSIPGYFNAGLDDARKDTGQPVRVSRRESENIFTAVSADNSSLRRPFTQRLDPLLTGRLLQDTLGSTGRQLSIRSVQELPDYAWKPFYTQATDSVLKIMMHRSDNFFAEQLLLMCGQALTGQMSDARAIRALLQGDFSDILPRPRWVDGSGLSRYNKMSPRFLVNLLLKMKETQDWARLQEVLPHGNEGTLKDLYTDYEDRIWGKTGTLSGDVALSGYLISEKGNPYVFSFLVNHHQTSAQKVRREVERILTEIIEKH